MPPLQSAEIRAQTPHPKVGADIRSPDHRTLPWEALRWWGPTQAAEATWDESHRGRVIHKSPSQVVASRWKPACVASSKGLPKPATRVARQPDLAGTGTTGSGQGVGGVLPGRWLPVALPLPSRLLNIYPTWPTIRKVSWGAMGCTFCRAQYSPKCPGKKNLVSQENNRMPVFTLCQCQTLLKARC